MNEQEQKVLPKLEFKCKVCDELHFEVDMRTASRAKRSGICVSCAPSVGYRNPPLQENGGLGTKKRGLE